MPLIRIEMPSTRDEAKRLLAQYESGARDLAWEERVVDEAWRRGRTPTGRVRFVGVTNGQPPSLKFDVEVHPEVHAAP